MSDNIEKELEKEVRTCKEETDIDAKRVYDILRRLTYNTRRDLQCLIWDVPLTKPLKKTYSDLVHDNDD